MHATIRRYEGVDLTRTDELVSNVNETLVPQLRELAGFRLLPARTDVGTGGAREWCILGRRSCGRM